MGNILKVDGAGGLQAFVRQDVAATPDFYLQFCVYFPSELLDDPDVQAYDFITICEVRSDGGDPLSGFTGSLNELVLNWDVGSAWQLWWDSGAGGPIPFVFDSDTWYRIGFRWFSTTMFEVEINGTAYGPFDSGTDGGDVNTFALGASAPDSSTPEAWYYDNVTAGTSAFGSSDIFADDFEGGDLSGWTSTTGDVAVIENTLGTECGGAVADFVGTPTSGGPPLIVDFTDASSGGTETAWAWDFGDGGTSTLQNPTHIYGSPGSYTVTLVVTIDGSDFTKTRTNYIVVSTPLVVSLRGSWRRLDQIVLPSGGGSDGGGGGGGSGGSDGTIPNISITNPTEGEFVAGAVPVDGLSSDTMSVSKVEVSIDGGAYQLATGTDAWSFSFDSTLLADGPHTITAKATSTSGLTATAVRSINVLNASPQPCTDVATFGAVGDGVHNDTAALQAAFNSGGDVCSASGKTFLVTADLNLTHGADFRGSVVKGGGIHTVSGLDARLSNVTVKNATIGVRVSSGHAMVCSGVNSNNSQWGFYIASGASALTSISGSASGNTIGLEIHGTGGSVPVFSALSNNGFGIIAYDAVGWHFGQITTNDTGNAALAQAGTGFEFWQNCHDNIIDSLTALKNPGYGLAFNHSSNRNTVTKVYCDAAGALDSDPAVTFADGCSDNTITTLTAKNHTVGVRFGENDSGTDLPCSRNTVTNMVGSNLAYGGIRFEHGDDNRVVNADLTDIRTVDAGFSRGGIEFSPNGFATNRNSVGSVVMHGTLKPTYAIHFGPQAANNHVDSGSVLYITAKVLDAGTGNTTNVTG